MKKIITIAVVFILVFALPITAFASGHHSRKNTKTSTVISSYSSLHYGACPYEDDCPYGSFCKGYGECLYGSECAYSEDCPYGSLCAEYGECLYGSECPYGGECEYGGLCVYNGKCSFNSYNNSITQRSGIKTVATTRTSGIRKGCCR